jgi:hypothetical protein
VIFYTFSLKFYIESRFIFESHRDLDNHLVLEHHCAELKREPLSPGFIVYFEAFVHWMGANLTPYR